MRAKKQRAPTASSAAPARRVAPRDAASLRRRKAWFRVIAVAVPLINLLLLEVVLRLAGYGYATSFFLEGQFAGQRAYVDNQQFARRYFPPGLERTPRPVVLPAAKPAGALRIFVFGESAAMGDPEPAFGLARILEVMLAEALPGKRIEVVNVAVTAINSHVIREIARDCVDKQGDYWILYMGNNEVVGPFGAGTVFGRQTPGLSFIRANLAVKTTRLGQLLDALGYKLSGRGGVPRAWEGMEMFLRQQVPENDPRLAKVYAHFAANLADIVQLGKSAGARVLLSTVASNLKDSPPFGSGHRPGLTEAQTKDWVRHFQTGAHLEQEGNPTAAVAEYAEAAKVDAGYAELAFRAAGCRARSGQLVQAATEFERARDLDTLRFRADTRINQIIRSTAANDTGLRWVDAVQVLATNSPGGIPGSELFYEHVHLNFGGNYLVARAFADSILKDTNSNAPVVLTEAECARRLALTDYERLLIQEEIQKRLQQPPFTLQAGHESRARNLAAEVNRLSVARRNEAFPAAAALYQAAITRAPDDWTLRENFAQFLQAHGQFAAAEEQWRKVIGLVPHAEAPYYGLGNVLDSLGRSAEAVSYFRAALQRRPGAVEARNGLGLALANQGDAPGALAEYERALRQKPTFGEARVNLGQLLAQQGRPAEARDQYLEALRLDSNNVAAHVNLGKLLVNLGQTNEAIGHYRQAIRLKPENAIAHHNLGNALNGLGDTAGAAQHFGEAVQCDPALADAHYNLGLCLARLNRLADALRHFGEAARLRPEMAEARFNYGVALAKAQRYDEAVREFQETLRVEPANTQARKFLEQAQALLRKAP